MALAATSKKSKLRQILGAVFALSLTFSCAAKADDFKLDGQQIAYYQSGTEAARVRLLIELIKNNHADMAEALMKRFPLAGPLAQNRIYFLQGLILESRGQLADSATKFRAALANDPKLTLVRSELAMVLARMNETDSAKHHLELLAADAPDSVQQAGIRSFIDSLNASHPFTFSGFISIAPSTNINQGSSHDTVYSPGLGGTAGVDPFGTIAASSQKQSGTGAAAGFNVGYSKNLSERIQAVLAVGANGTYYPVTGLTSAGLSQSAELRYITGHGFVGFGGTAAEGIDTTARALNYTSYGPRLSWAHRLTERDQFTGYVSYEWRNYAGSPSFNGNALTLWSVFTHALDSSSNVALMLGYDSVKQQDAFNSYYGGTFGLGFYKELPHGVTVQSQGTAHLAQFYDQNPFTLSTRQDTNLAGSLTLTKRDWNWFGFAPSLNYTYTRNFSNISIYDYDSHSVDFRLTKDF